MPQHDMIIANAVGATFRADINDALAALVANSSGATEPATKYAYMWWADTTTGALKQRNGANTAWIEKGALADTVTSGTWTPNQGGGLTVVGAFSSEGLYVKVGRHVTVRGKVAGATSVAYTNTGYICTNLPFTSAAAFHGIAMSAALATITETYTAGAQVAAAANIAASTYIEFSFSYITT